MAFKKTNEDLFFECNWLLKPILSQDTYNLYQHHTQVASSDRNQSLHKEINNLQINHLHYNHYAVNQSTYLIIKPSAC